VSIARDVISSRLAIHAAMGFGRSYGKDSGFMGKKFSGIFFSRLWDDYEKETCASTLAFVTDIGNDLAYEEPSERIMEWVEACVTRLAHQGARVALTNVPIEVLRSMSCARYELLRTLLFPKCKLAWPVILGRAEELHERLALFAKVQKMPIFTVPNAWYGFDPIHPRSSRLADYWRAMLALSVTPGQVNESRSKTLGSYWRIRTLSTPDLRRPASNGHFLSSRAILADGSSIALY
jgi:hypothetical protein